MTAPVELQTERLLLRRFRAEDVDDALEYRNDEEFVRFLPHVPHPFTRDDAERFVHVNMTEDWRTLPTFAVVWEGRLIGTVNLEIDHASGTAMLGYALGRRWWGHGIATEASMAAISWARRAFGLRRIWAATDLRNQRSQRVLQKLGFTKERVRVAEHPDRDGTRVEEVVYGRDITV